MRCKQTFSGLYWLRHALVLDTWGTLHPNKAALFQNVSVGSGGSAVLFSSSSRQQSSCVLHGCDAALLSSGIVMSGSHTTQYIKSFTEVTSMHKIIYKLLRGVVESPSMQIEAVWRCSWTKEL